jgi:hypothetical protein
MNERVRADFSTPLTSTTGQEWVLDARYDFVRIFKWLQFGVINIVTEEGIQRLYVDEAQARHVGERAMLPIAELEWICESEYEQYLAIQQDNLDDSWLA